MLSQAKSAPIGDSASVQGWRVVWRRVRYGAPIVVVSGLPRSGTSMAMRMLAAGGLPILTDGLRTADDSNPHGYFEFEPVKSLDQPAGDQWLRTARGRAVKIISHLLTHLPESYQYDVIFMERDLDEVLASQNRMLTARGKDVEARSDGAVRSAYERHLVDVRRFLKSRACFRTLFVSYRDVINDPLHEASRIATFLGGRLDASKMASMTDTTLYRNRR